MIETGLRISDNTLNIEVLSKAIEYGKELLEKPIDAPRSPPTGTCSSSRAATGRWHSR